MERKEECRRFDYARYRHGDMSPPDKRAYELHVATCDYCNNEKVTMENLFEIVSRESVENRDYCLNENELTDVVDNGVIEGTPVARHLRHCPICQAEVEVLKSTQIPSKESLSPLPEKVRDFIRSLGAATTGKVVSFPIMRLKRLATRGPEQEFRMAASDQEEVPHLAEEHKEDDALIVASVSGKGEFLVTVERRGQAARDAVVEVQAVTASSETQRLVSATTDTNGEVNFGALEKFPAPTAGTRYEIRVTLPE